MSCGCGSSSSSNGVYNDLCNADIPYPSVSSESVPSLISNLVLALYGPITKDVSSGKVVWSIPCDPATDPATLFGIPRNEGEGLLCYFIRAFSGYITPNKLSTGAPYWNSAGNLGLGTTTPSYRLQLSTDSAAKPSTNTWTIASDARLKENIHPFTKGLDVVGNINPVYYDYNGKAGFTPSKGNVGVIAQDIQNVVPEGVSTYKAKLNNGDEQETELLNFNSHSLTYILINAVKELKAKVDQQDAEILLVKSELKKALSNLNN